MVFLYTLSFVSITLLCINPVSSSPVIMGKKSKSKSSSTSSGVGSYLTASSGSSTSGRASYPDSITGKNLPTIVSKLSSIKSSTVDSHPYYTQALTEIQIDNIIASGAKKSVVTKKSVAKPVTKKSTTAKSKVAEVKAPAQDLSKMTVSQLKEIAKTKGITGISSMKKADLISALS